MMIRTKNRAISGFNVGDKFKIKSSNGIFSIFDNPTIQIKKITPCPRHLCRKYGPCVQEHMIGYIYLDGGLARSHIPFEQARCQFQNHEKYLERIQ